MKIDVVQTSFVTVVNFTLSGESKDLTLKTFNSVDDSSSKFIDQLQFLHRNTQSTDPCDAIALFYEIHSKTSDSSDSINETFNEETSVIVTEENSVTDYRTDEGDEMSTKEISCGCANHMEKRSVNTIIPIDCALAFDLMFGPNCPVQHAIQVRRKNRSNFHTIKKQFFTFLDYKISDWKVGESGIEEREESYLFPLNNPLVRAKETECFVTIKLTKKIHGK